MITQEILDSFVYQTIDGRWLVTDPTEFDQNMPGGYFETKELAEEAFKKYVEETGVTFE